MRTVAVLVQPGARAFDLAVIGEVWGRHIAGSSLPVFELGRCAAGPEPVALPGGLSMTPDRDLEWLVSADLVVVPGLADPATPTPEPLLAALRAAHARGTPVAALCAGAFVLARAGLLDGRRAVTHWWLADRLAAEWPAAEVVSDALFVHDDGVWTSAGVAAGIDLCLHLVREAHGSEPAATLARAMVTGPFRAGGDAQVLDLPVPVADRTARVLGAVRARALERLHEPLSVGVLAGWAGMSPRAFTRHFAAATGTTPHEWLLRRRLDEARRLLERTDHPVPEVARRAGFGSEVTMRQHFAARFGCSPREHRRTHAGRVRSGSGGQ
ncbi:GlxA family transcriptional regulator [Streptomyces sp. BI20]|uniref:GlxA family transcriptional regulator n=1 Tax=Streptomyces sp. BI20 TaxID=3403460 RepID=UPI003C745770